MFVRQICGNRPTRHRAIRAERRDEPTMVGHPQALPAASRGVVPYITT
jgi:hypothetical protein